MRLLFTITRTVTPLQICVFSLYVFFLYMCLTSIEFIPFWVYIEFAMFMFMILAFSTVESSSYTSLCVYYLIQALSSLSIIGCYFIMEWYQVEYVVLFIYIVLFIKLGLFPFNFWYFSSVGIFSKFPLFLSITLQKLPPVYLFSGFVFPSNTFSLWVGYIFIGSMLLTLIISVYISLKVNWGCIKSLLIVSSIFNGVWLMVFGLVSLTTLYIFLGIYSISILLILYSKKLDVLAIFNLIGLPPFPIFFLKLFVIYIFFMRASVSYINLFIFTLLLVNSLFLSLYFTYLTYSISLKAGAIRSLFSKN